MRQLQDTKRDGLYHIVNAIIGVFILGRQRGMRNFLKNFLKF